MSSIEMCSSQMFFVRADLVLVTTHITPNEKHSCLTWNNTVLSSVARAEFRKSLPYVIKSVLTQDSIYKSFSNFLLVPCKSYSLS